ncbi:bacteriocin biosynthesis cyclodehydratase domain-containing protein [Streptacidiphilus sp. EB129]
MKKPRLKAHVVAEVVGDSKVFLLAEGQHLMLSGEAPVKVLPFLDGTRTTAEICGELAGEIPLQQTLSVIRKFQALGQLADGAADGDRSAVAHWDGVGVDPALAATRLASTTVTLVGVGDAAVEPVRAALEQGGLRVVTADLDALSAGAVDGPVVVLVEDYLMPQLEKLNDVLLGGGRPWLLAKPGGQVLWLGPYFQPGTTGCWACLAERVEGNRQVERYLINKHADRTPFLTSMAAAPGGTALFTGLLVNELAKVLTGAQASTRGKLVTIDQRTLRLEEHELVRQPQCAACGNPALVSERDPRIELTRDTARISLDGGYRVVTPEATLERLSKHIDPILGAVTELTSFADIDNGVTYSYRAGHNFAMGGDNLDLLRRNLRGQSGGKGRSDVQARTSAVCEAIERYCGIWTPARPVVRAAYADLGPDLAVGMDLLGQYSERQYAEREQYNDSPAGRLNGVPRPLGDDERIDWTTAWSLTAQRERKIPAAFSWFGHPDLYSGFCMADANGCASGNTLEEAVLQGFSELVERDSVALWWYNRLRMPEFDIDSLQEPYVDMLRDFYAGMGRTFWLLDLTSDLGIPAFAGVSQRVDHPVQDLLLGFGAHPDARVAALRALTEVNQFLPAVERRDAAGNTAYWEDDPYTLSWWAETSVENQPWLTPDRTRRATTLADYPQPGGRGIADVVEQCNRRVAEAGMEMIVLDQSRPDIELSVARVVVPGMRHFWRRLAPGRLYDVPVRMGLLAEPTPEERLNPWSVFF